MSKGVRKMILTADNCDEFISTTESLDGQNPFACRIISLCTSYQPSLPFVDYWTVFDDESKNPTGAIARNGTDFILFLTDKTDLDEVSSFMRVAGATSVICSNSYSLDLFGYEKTSGPILVRREEIPECNSFEICTPQIKDAYNLIAASADKGFTPPEFEDFYVDINHKLRHGTMRLLGLCSEGELAAVAMTVAESSQGAVIGAVACLPEHRKKGYGTYIVNHLTNILVKEGRSVFLHRAENANKAFYDNLKFSRFDSWCEYHFKG